MTATFDPLQLALPERLLTPRLVLRGVTVDGDQPGRLLGGCGLHCIDWNVRRFEIGYWRRTSAGPGLIDEAVQALTRFAFDELRAQRVEIRMDARNDASRRVAERNGYTFEGVLRADSLTPSGEPRDTRLYARVRGVEEA
jgi:RimJ/RimL family protein N-acetyltransferase